LVKKCIPGETNRNFSSDSYKISALSDHQKNVLCEPQTKGGLPVPVAPKEVHEAREVFAVNELDQEPFGDIVEKMNSPSL